MVTREHLAQRSGVDIDRTTASLSRRQLVVTGAVTVHSWLSRSLNVKITCASIRRSVLTEYLKLSCCSSCRLAHNHTAWSATFHRFNRSSECTHLGNDRRLALNRCRLTFSLLSSPGQWHGVRLHAVFSRTRNVKQWHAEERIKVEWLTVGRQTWPGACDRSGRIHAVVEHLLSNSLEICDSQDCQHWSRKIRDKRFDPWFPPRPLPSTPPCPSPPRYRSDPFRYVTTQTQLISRIK